MTNETFQPLLDAARAAADSAYAPYSGYRVGASLRTLSGEIVGGCNVENASYGLSVCAERAAVFAAVSRGLVSASAPIAAFCVHVAEGATPWPCGACRQVLAQFAPPSLRILVDGPEGQVVTTLADLLPNAFQGGRAGPAR